ncbi:MAG: alkaline phosphatase family protein [Acidobacteria bacterium]|nr:alkaline phosphatase family protein [Acidobacteriota bacterium]
MPFVRRLAAGGILLVLLGALPPPAAQTAAAPRLLLFLVVDQMRFDYIEQMRSRWTHGLKRLVTEGAVFERSRYPYLQTVTCAGHATIGTGTFPARHGIVLNAWWRGTRNAPCTEDTGVKAVPYEPDTEVVGHSAVQLLVPTMADRLRAASPESRVVSLSIKPRSAIMMAGSGGVVAWTDDRNRWATSTAYAAAPDPDVQAFVAAHPRLAVRGEVWERLLDVSSYTGTDAGLAEKPPNGWTTQFPHPLAGAAGTSEEQFYTLWENSPYSDAYLGAMAADLVARKKLGQRSSVDFLGVSFSALDYIGHKFGPESHEVQDALLRLDRTIGDLLETLDRLVGPDRYLVGLSADHGVAPIPEARVASGREGGRVPTQQLMQAANAALVESLGPGQHVARVEYTQIYLAPEARQRVLANPALLEPVTRALEHVPGIARAMPGAGLEGQQTSPAPLVRAAALSHVPDRSGQIVVIPSPYYVIGGSDATTHGTHHAYDQHVPLIFFGAGVKPGRYQTPSTPADLAPTLAARIGLEMPGTDGVAHTAVFDRR